MTEAQQEILIGYLQEPTCVIRSIEYPSGLTIATEVGSRQVLNLLKICHETTVHERAETRGYVDWYTYQGDRVKTEYKGVIE